MKFSIGLATLALIVSNVNADLLRGFSFDNSLSDLISIDEPITYTKPFVALGGIKGVHVCEAVETICNGLVSNSVQGSNFAFASTTEQLVSCYAAHKALARMQGGWGAAGLVSVTAGNGSIQKISLDSAARASSVAVSFSQSSANNKVTAYSLASASVGAETENGFPFAAAKASATAIADSGSVGFASGKSMTGSSAEGSAIAASRLEVQGSVIDSFVALISVGATGFAQSASQQSALSIAKAASNAFVGAFAEECLFNGFPAGCEVTASADARVKAIAIQFGKAVGQGLTKLQISFSFSVKIVDTGSEVKIEITQDGDARGVAGTNCAAST